MQNYTLEESSDGTRKVIYKEGHIAVLIPSKDEKWTLCVSCSIGCPVGCKFCWTPKLERHLDKDEIVQQVRDAKKIVGKVPTAVVCMGMGEPMFNFRAVDAALHQINTEFGISFKHMTLSTSGFYLEKLEEVPYHVALSLHTPFDSVRKKLMPVTKSVAELVQFAKDYSTKRKFGLMIQYALMKGVNDGDDDLAELLQFDWPKNVFFNVIEYNNKGEFVKSDRLIEFKEAIRKAGYKCFIRHSRGADIAAACGMLEY